MKKVFSIIVVTTALSLSSSAVLPAGAYSYKSGFVETFDAMKTATNAPTLSGKLLWSVIADGYEYANKLVVPVANTSGRTFTGFNAGLISNTDRQLAVGKSSVSSYFITQFVNDTGSTLTEIELYYDMECCWLQLNGKTPLPARLIVSLSTNGTTWVDMGTNLIATVLNTSATMGNTWLTDTQMDAQKLSCRNAGGIAPLPAGLPSINPGQKFYVRWATDTDNPSSKMTYGIDNIRLFTDSDNDGLSNAKEASLGTDPNKADSDGDGMSDGDEVAYGTDPQDPTSAFVVELKNAPAPAPATNDQNTVDFPAADGKYYTLLFSESMTGTFTAVPGCIRLTGKKGERLYCIHSTTTEIGFYKLLIE